MAQYPRLTKHKAEIKKLLKKNITCICRVQTKEVTGIKVLPLFQNIKKEGVSKVHHALADFMTSTGIGIGGVNLQKKLVNALAEQSDVKYAVKSEPYQKRALYYVDEKDFTRRNTYQRMLGLFSSPTPHMPPPIHLLGKATMDLLEGLFSKLTNRDWKAIDPAFMPIVQSSLYRIHENLAVAELNLNNFNLFAGRIELIHAEIATLLELFKPYKEGDFDKIYSQAVQPMLPPELKQNFTVGLGKTSVNVFSGYQCGTLKEQSSFQSCVQQRLLL